jgi:hypothetical protein
VHVASAGPLASTHSLFAQRCHFWSLRDWTHAFSGTACPSVELEQASVPAVTTETLAMARST